MNNHIGLFDGVSLSSNTDDEGYFLEDAPSIIDIEHIEHNLINMPKYENNYDVIEDFIDELYLAESDGDKALSEYLLELFIQRKVEGND